MTRVMLSIGSLFAGIGGLELGLEQAGLGPVLWQVERDEKCRKVLARHWPHAVRYGAIEAIEPATLAPVAIVCGGFPCQPVSVAGKGLAERDPRWLWPEFRRVIEGVRPRFVVIENVPGLVRRGLDGIVQELAGLGYEVEGTRIAAEDLGAPHKRERLFLLAHAVGVVVRHEQGGRGGTKGPRAAMVCSDGRSGPMAHAHGKGQLQPGRVERAIGGWPSNGRREVRAWPVEPSVGRVAHGLSGRVDRLRQLGNAVVPACAEIVGHRILELAAASSVAV